ncbi:phage portal protein [Candidatus Enterococcus ferrettii]|uniref:Phage portal protein n=2 Tax=Candidatus Enterococcus ferrettii TaxID=2815324 RepID=A0ABV0EV82_9ENTE|nr:phage portal protein [Enterococcus sp. 665A]
MFDKLRSFLRRGGAKIGVVETLNSILDHPKINMPADEYSRILENKRMYQQLFPKVQYITSEGRIESREYHSINVAKVISHKLAKLVFNEGCQISLDDTTADEFLQEVFAKNKFRKNFGEELEAGYSISGLVMRPYFDEGSQTIKISYCQADSFYPLQSNTNDISEAAIATTTQEVVGDKTIYYTLLEFHEWMNGTYVISNELYQSESAYQVGVRVPLTSVEKYKDIQPISRMEGFTRPLFVYIKLAGKNNKNLGSPLGAGVIDNAKKQLRDLNDKYDQFMWEIDKAATKIMASDHFFRVRYDTKGNPIRRFDSKTDVFQQLKTDEPFIDAFAPSLRSQEYIDSINFILRIVEMQTGFSAGTFSFDGQSVKTATEIISENSETYSTRSDNVQIISEAMKELVITIFELAEACGLYRGETDFAINVDFDDGVFESKEAQLDYNTKAVTAQMMPKIEAMKRQYGLSDKEAMQWFKLIMMEQNALDPGEVQAFIEQQELGDDE